MTYLMFFAFMWLVFLFLCSHMIVAAMIKNTMLVRNITITGAMKAQMNLVSGFMKQL